MIRVTKVASVFAAMAATSMFAAEHAEHAGVAPTAAHLGGGLITNSMITS